VTYVVKTSHTVDGYSTPYSSEKNRKSLERVVESEVMKSVNVTVVSKLTELVVVFVVFVVLVGFEVVVVLVVFEVVVVLVVFVVVLEVFVVVLEVFVVVLVVLVVFVAVVLRWVVVVRTGQHLGTQYPQLSHHCPEMSLGALYPLALQVEHFAKQYEHDDLVCPETWRFTKDTAAGHVAIPDGASALVTLTEAV